MSFSARIFVIGWVLLISASCDRATTDLVVTAAPLTESEKERAAVIGAEAAKTLTESLGGQLKAAMASGGPVAAIDVCRQVALPLTKAAGNSVDGVTLRRVTMKPRNPVNGADATDMAVLEAMQAQPAPEVAILRVGERIRYYRPLMIQEVCLKCHGDPTTFSKELSAILAEKYPHDTATGYALGDLRGAVRVDIVEP